MVVYILRCGRVGDVTVNALFASLLPGKARKGWLVGWTVAWLVTYSMAKFSPFFGSWSDIWVGGGTGAHLKLAYLLPDHSLQNSLLFFSCLPPP